jgi:hypothetical protein
MEKMSFANYLDVSEDENSGRSRSRHKKKKERSSSESSSRRHTRRSKKSTKNKKKYRKYSSSSSSSSSSSKSSSGLSRSRSRKRSSSKSSLQKVKGIKVPKWSTVDDEDELCKREKKIITIGKKPETELETEPEPERGSQNFRRNKVEDIKPNKNIPVEEKEKPNFEPSGLLAKQTNTKK